MQPFLKWSPLCMMILMVIIAVLFQSPFTYSKEHVKHDAKSTKDLSKVESELEDAQARLETVKQRLEMNDEEDKGSLLSNVVDSVKNTLSSNNIEDPIQHVDETLAEKAGRHLRETIGSETLADRLQQRFNDAKQELYREVKKQKLNVDHIGAETVQERTARRVREILGQDTLLDQLQQKYIDAKNALLESKELDLTAYTDKIQYLNDRMTKLGEAAQAKLLESSDENSIWHRIKGKLGLTREPTLSEKKHLIQQHRNLWKANDASLSEVDRTFNRFIKSVGRTPADAVDFAKQWIESDPNERVAVRKSHAIPLEAHEALDDLLSKLLSEIEQKQAYIRSLDKIELDVLDKNEEKLIEKERKQLQMDNEDDNKDKNKEADQNLKLNNDNEQKKLNSADSPSLINSIQNSLYGTEDSDVDADGVKLNDASTKHGQQGLKERVSDIINSVKSKTIGVDTDKEQIVENNLPNEETLTEKATRTIRESIGQSTEQDQTAADRERRGLLLDGINTDSIINAIRSKLPDKYQSGKEFDIRKTLKSMTDETMTEKAARKVRESLGTDTFSDKLFNVLDDIRSSNDLSSYVSSSTPSSTLSAASNYISDKYDDIKDLLSSFTGESRIQRMSRKIREALGRDTVLDKAHSTVDDAVLNYHSLIDSSSSKVKNMKNSVSDTIDHAKAHMATESKKSKLESLHDAVFGNSKDKKVENAKSLLQEAIAKLDEAKKM